MTQASFILQTAGLHPTAEQIEMFAYHLPDATLSNLVVSNRASIYSPARQQQCVSSDIHIVKSIQSECEEFK